MGTATLDYLRTREGVLKDVSGLVEKGELGGAAFRESGPGEGDLMEVGFLGWGGVGSLEYAENLDRLMARGLYRFDQNTIGRPYDGPGWVWNVVRASGAITQLSSRQLGSGTNQVLLVRVKSLNGWGQWGNSITDLQSFRGLNGQAELIKDMAAESDTHFFRTDINTEGSIPVANHLVGMHIKGYMKSRVKLSISRITGLVFTSSWNTDGSRNPDNVMWGTYNTTVDSNGFIKEASPIIKLYADTAEANPLVGHFTFEKPSSGVYIIKGTKGLAKSGWYVETPRDANGNIKVFIDYHQDEDNTITVRTFEPVYENGRAVAGEPVDIPTDRWIDIRLHEDTPAVDLESEVAIIDGDDAQEYHENSSVTDDEAETLND